MTSVPPLARSDLPGYLLMMVRDARFSVLSFLCMALLAGFTAVSVGQAQDTGMEGPGAVQERPLAPETGTAGNVPDWAEPRSSSSQPPRRSLETEGRGMRTKDLGTNPNPQIPLGGLEWLLLAGGGYGLWKLRREA